MLGGASSKGHMQREGGCAVVRQGRSIALVVAFLIGCAVILLAVGCAGVRSRASQEEQARSPEATASEEEARCQGTRTYDYRVPITEGPSGVLVFTTNDIPGCPKGGLLLGTDKPDKLAGKDGDDKIRGLGATDQIVGGSGNDVIYARPGGDPVVDGDEGDDVLYAGPDGAGLGGGPGEDVLYGGDGNDVLDGARGHGARDKLYCGEGRDTYFSDKNDYVANSCEVRETHGGNWGNA